MKRLITLTLIACTLCLEAIGQEVRKTANFNSEWRFSLGDVEKASAVDFDDSAWHRVGLPHSFSTPYFESKEFYTGYGWYRKTFTLSKDEVRGQVSLEFDGVFQEAEVFVNGYRAGHHIGGYTGFEVCLTPYAVAGNNVVAVRVNNLWRPDVAPRAGEHVFSGGIYRDVRLVVKGKTHIDWCGTCVRTPHLAASQGRWTDVELLTDISNKSSVAGRYTLVSSVVDADGKIMAKVSRDVTVMPGKTMSVEQTTPKIRNPKLWSPEHPDLYKLVSELRDGGRLVDNCETTFGFRWVEWTADRGFFINGHHLYFHGANVHQDQAGWGDAVTDSAAWRDVKMVKDVGMDFIRGSHYPHSPAFVGACNTLGMLFWSEAPFWGTGGGQHEGGWTASAYPVSDKDTAAFERSCLQQLGEMIHIHRNSPAVVAWSMSNEPFFTARGTIGKVKRLLVKMVAEAHRLDPTRVAAIGGCQRPTDSLRIDHVGDVAGYNGDGATISEFQNPGIPSVVTEYGSTIDVRPGKYAPGWGDLAKDDGYKGEPWRCGQSIWCAFDHGTIATGDFGRMGFIDYERLPKRRWYWYRNEYKHIAPPEWPVEGTPKQLRLTASKTAGIRADGTDDVQLVVTVLDSTGHELTSTPDVTLRIASGPGEFPTGSHITFTAAGDIFIREGKAAIALRSYYAGHTVLEATSEGLSAARVELTFSGAQPFVEGTTPPCDERPYKRFTAEKRTEETVTYGKGNPCFASTMQPSHTSSMATDGNAATYWQAQGSDSAPAFTLDTERCIGLANLELNFPQPAPYRYVAESSMDGERWYTLDDMRQNNTALTLRKLDLTSLHVEARFIRLRYFQDKQHPAVLSEIAVAGKSTAQ